MQSHVKGILAYIESYNRSKPAEEDKIHFLHGGNSAVFALIGRQVKTPRRIKLRTNPLETEVLEFETMLVEKKLYATGVLRKKFGIYPFSGELSTGALGDNTSRKTGVNYKSISGMRATADGVRVTAGYAFIQRSFQPGHFHDRVLKTILHIEKDNCIRSMKKLVMEITNMMMLYPENEHKKEYYLNLLRNERDNIWAKNKSTPELTALLKKYDKYYKRLADILDGKNLPFKPDATFHEMIKQQFPIIFCSTQSGVGFKSGVDHEVLIAKELDLNTVKLLFTQENYVRQLQQCLRDANLEHIKVIGVPKSALPEPTAIKQDSIEQFAIHVHEVFNNDDSDSDKYKAFKFFKSYKEIIRMLKNIPFDNWATSNITNNYFNNYAFIQDKLKADPDYIMKTNGAITDGYFERLKKIAYIDALIQLNALLRDNDTKIDIEKIFHIKQLSNVKYHIFNLLKSTDNNYDKVTLLQNLFIYFKYDPDSQLQASEKQFLIDLYIPLIDYLTQDNTLGISETDSELYQEILHSEESKEESKSEHPGHVLLENIERIHNEIATRTKRSGLDPQLHELYKELDLKIMYLKNICQEFLKQNITENQFINLPSIKTALQAYDEIAKKIDTRMREIVIEVYQSDLDSADDTQTLTLFGKQPPEDHWWDIDKISTRVARSNHTP